MILPLVKFLREVIISLSIVRRVAMCLSVKRLTVITPELKCLEKIQWQSGDHSDAFCNEDGERKV